MGRDCVQTTSETPRNRFKWSNERHATTTGNVTVRSEKRDTRDRVCTSGLRKNYVPLFFIVVPSTSTVSTISRSSNNIDTSRKRNTNKYRSSNRRVLAIVSPFESNGRTIPPLARRGKYRNVRPRARAKGEPFRPRSRTGPVLYAEFITPGERNEKRSLGEIAPFARTRSTGIFEASSKRLRRSFRTNVRRYTFDSRIRNAVLRRHRTYRPRDNYADRTVRCRAS